MIPSWQKLYPGVNLAAELLMIEAPLLEAVSGHRVLQFLWSVFIDNRGHLVDLLGGLVLHRAEQSLSLTLH